MSVNVEASLYLMLEPRHKGAYKFHMADVIAEGNFFHNPAARAARAVLVTGGVYQVRPICFYVDN